MLILPSYGILSLLADAISHFISSAIPHLSLPFSNPNSNFRTREQIANQVTTSPLQFFFLLFTISDSRRTTDVSCK
jgi:hypothetical protein